ncbi:Wzz/FepE/Etk N-terminal domain-containing protein [Pedobacter gandavensis]|uniref:Wzz/FepE/Etk N-terminal domain-containing protein n=1 Tax=Pedobacter gandavensis TaxID=2679963 RepID=UPI00292E22A0|nr:Wzz/FepE/Etk N-terminal domain-containing protein [Pedobacter gandavensis]
MNLEDVNNDPITSEDLSLRDIVFKTREWYKYLLSKWIFILLVAAIGALLGFAYASYKKPIYTATTTFVLEEGDKPGGLGQYAGLASMAGIDLGGGGGGIFQGDNILELYKSRSMIQKTLLSVVPAGNKKELLIDKYIQFNKLRDKWKSNDLKNISFSDTTNFTRLKDSVLREIIKDINRNYLFVSKPDKKLGIINVTVKSNNEWFAKTFTDQIVTNVNQFYVETKTKKSIQNIQILQHQTDSVRSIMNGAIFQSASVLDATPNLNPTRQTLRAPVQRSQFSAETNKAILGELVKNLELSKISLRKEMPLIQVIDKPILPLEEEKLGKLKGMVLGGFLSGFIVVFIIIVRKFVKDSLK